jgi:hypothetical protein
LEGLLPGRYAIRVQNNSYSTWQKSVIVDEGFVSEFSKILLLPQSEEGLIELNKEIALIFVPIQSPLSGATESRILDSPAPASAGGRIGTSPTSTPTVEPFAIKKGVLSTTNEELFDKTQNKPAAEGEPRQGRERIAENVKGFVLSKDKNKLAWWTANELWVMWLDSTNYQPYHKKGDKELITRFSTQIKKVDWFRDEDHLIVDSSGYKILEIDTRGGINIVER